MRLCDAGVPPTLSCYTSRVKASVRKVAGRLSFLFLFLLWMPAAWPQSELDQLVERRIVTYIRQHVVPGEFFVVTDLYRIHRTQAEKRVIDRLYYTFFKIPLFVAQYKKDTGKFPTLEDIARHFELQVDGEAAVLLSIFEADPRAPKFFSRDPVSGEIIGMDMNAAGENLPAFGLSRPDVGKAKTDKAGQSPIEPIITEKIACEKAAGDVSLEQALARPLIAEGFELEDTTYFYNRVDLNGDGIPEVLAYLRGPRTCNSSGCELFVLRKEGSQYTVISRVYMGWRQVVVSSRRTEGWNDLILWTDPSDGNPGRYLVVPFDGKAYRRENAHPLSEKVDGPGYMSNSHDVGTGIVLPPRINEYGKTDVN